MAASTASTSPAAAAGSPRASNSGRTQLRLRPPWSLTDVQLGGRRSVAVCALLPIGAWLVGLMVGPSGPVLTGLVAVAILVAYQRATTPTITVDDHQVRIVEATVTDGAGAATGWFGGDVAGKSLPCATVEDLQLLARADADELLHDHDGIRDDRGRWIQPPRRRGGPHLDATPYRRLPPAATAADDTAALLVTIAAGRDHRRTLLPVWRPSDGRRLLRAVATATGRLDPAVIAATWPDPTDRWSMSRRAALRAERGRLAVVGVAATAAVTVIWQVLRLLRATTLDALLGTWAGLAVRTLSTAVLLAAIATAVVGVAVTGLASVVWRRAERPVTWRQAVDLARLRTGWLLWQLRIWLAGTALLWTVSGVGTPRYALGYTLASGIIPGAQALHEVVRRTVEEATTSTPPPLRRVRLAHQWLSGAAAVALLAYRAWA